MSDETRDVSGVEEEDSEKSRRDFLSKSAMTAGTAAVAAMLAGLVSSAGGAEIRRVQPTLAPAVSAARLQPLRNTQLQYQSLQKGSTFRLSGAQISDVLAREGLMPKDAMGKEAVMSLSLTWD